MMAPVACEQDLEAIVKCVVLGHLLSPGQVLGAVTFVFF